MTSRSTNEGQHDRRSGGGWLPPWLAVVHGRVPEKFHLLIEEFYFSMKCQNLKERFWK